jgi:hypothetical protein
LMNPTAATKFTSADLLLMSDDGKRYEVIEGDLYVSRQPHWHHQFACGQLFRFLQEWSERSGLGVANGAPGLIFAEDNVVMRSSHRCYRLSSARWRRCFSKHHIDILPMPQGRGFLRSRSLRLRFLARLADARRPYPL